MSQYNGRLGKIAEVEAKIDVCKQKLREDKLAQGEQADLRGVIHVLERELISERTKVKALPEKLERPMNVHRWRKLAGSDPKRFTVMEKIQVLQKRLISKTEAVLKRNQLIKEKEKLYVELKNILARQPGPATAITKVGADMKSVKQRYFRMMRRRQEEEDKEIEKAETSMVDFQRTLKNAKSEIAEYLKESTTL